MTSSLAFGRVIAQRKGGTLSYFLADHLGTTVETIDDVRGATPTTYTAGRKGYTRNKPLPS
jgi:hypothetical protein